MEKKINLYEQKEIYSITGDTIRPGGFYLTDKAVKLCGFNRGDKVLDLGCGMGATVNHLTENFHLNCIGIEPSFLLREKGKKKFNGINLIDGCGENIPIKDREVDGVFAECTLSLMEDLHKTLHEINRCIKKGGFLVVSDMYKRNINISNDFDKKINITCCLKGAKTKDEIISLVSKYGFRVLLWEEQTMLLKQLIVDIIMEYGSLDCFWGKFYNCKDNCEKIQNLMRDYKMGYYFLTAVKI